MFREMVLPLVSEGAKIQTQVYLISKFKTFSLYNTLCTNNTWVDVTGTTGYVHSIQPLFLQEQISI